MPMDLDDEILFGLLGKFSETGHLIIDLAMINVQELIECHGGDSDEGAASVHDSMTGPHQGGVTVLHSGRIDTPVPDKKNHYRDYRRSREKKNRRATCCKDTS